MTKDQIRKKMLIKMKKQKEDDRQRKSLAIKKRLFNLAAFKKAKNILLYVGKYYEVDTVSIIKGALKKKKRIFLPVADVKSKRLMISEISDIEKDTEIGPFGISQPKAVCRLKEKTPHLDLVVLPGVAFDKKGNRLGHGGGYYDKYLEAVTHNIPRVGLAFDFQVLDRDIPTLAHDIPVTLVVTN